MNKKILIAISFCLIATLLIPPVFAPSANSVLEIVKDIQTKVNTIISILANMYQKIWSDSNSVKNDTSRITTTQTNLGDWTLLKDTPRPGPDPTYYNIMRVMVTAGKAAQFTVTLESVDYLTSYLEVWVDVNDDNAANARALDIDCSASTPNYGTETFVGNSFVIRWNVPPDADPVPADKEMNWAYMVVAPPGVEITEEIWLS